MNIEIRKFDINSISDEIWNKFFDLSEAILTEIDPHEPLAPREMRKEFIRSRYEDPNLKNYRYLVFDKDNNETLVGYGRIEVESDKSPTYRIKYHIGQTDLLVDKNYRRKGVGTRLIKHIAPPWCNWWTRLPNQSKSLPVNLT